MIKSAKEAKEIIQLNKHLDKAIEDRDLAGPLQIAIREYKEAKGYLSCLKEGAEVRALVKRLEIEKQCGKMYGENICTRGINCESCKILSIYKESIQP